MDKGDIFEKNFIKALEDYMQHNQQVYPLSEVFFERIEALKQFIERVNSVLINKSIVDDFNLEKNSILHLR